MPSTLHDALLRLLFEWGAAGYAWGTGQPVWLASGAALAKRSFFPHDARVLDLGTGPGSAIQGMAREHPGASFIGLDLSWAMVRAAQERLRRAGVRAVLLRGDVARLPLADGSVDVVTGHSLLYLLPEPVAALREARRVLRPGGMLLFLEPRAGPVAWGALLRQYPREGRFLATMVGWRGVSALQGRYDPTRWQREVVAAGLQHGESTVALHGMALRCVARREG